MLSLPRGGFRQGHRAGPRRRPGDDSADEGVHPAAINGSLATLSTAMGADVCHDGHRVLPRRWRPAHPKDILSGRSPFVSGPGDAAESGPDGGAVGGRRCAGAQVDGGPVGCGDAPSTAAAGAGGRRAALQAAVRGRVRLCGPGVPAVRQRRNSVPMLDERRCCGGPAVFVCSPRSTPLEVSVRL